MLKVFKSWFGWDEFRNGLKFRWYWLKWILHLPFNKSDEQFSWDRIFFHKKISVPLELIYFKIAFNPCIIHDSPQQKSRQYVFFADYNIVLLFYLLDYHSPQHLRPRWIRKQFVDDGVSAIKQYFVDCENSERLELIGRESSDYIVDLASKDGCKDVVDHLRGKNFFQVNASCIGIDFRHAG